CLNSQFNRVKNVVRAILPRNSSLYCRQNKRAGLRVRMEQPQFQLMEEDQLSVELIDAQYNLKKTRGQKNAKSLVILVNGIELAGKGEAVKQLREWVDPRYLRVKADKPQL